jgi:DNA-binding NtrC family response regulator
VAANINFKVRSAAHPAIQTTPAVIVFEKRPRWGPELQRQFVTEDVRVIACRSVRDVEERAASAANGAVLLDASPAPADCLQFLKRGLLDPHALPVIIVASKGLAEREWLFRELGAIAFFSRTIAGHEMASLCRKQWAVSKPDRVERSATITQEQGTGRP